jgi:hypothetical protein
MQVNGHVRETADYLTSPLRPIIEEGRSIRVNPQDPSAASTYPIMRTLAAAGFTDYWGFALKREERQFSLMTLATCRAGGFSNSTVEVIEALLPALAWMHWSLATFGRGWRVAACTRRAMAAARGVLPGWTAAQCVGSPASRSPKARALP